MAVLGLSEILFPLAFLEGGRFTLSSFWRSIWAADLVLFDRSSLFLDDLRFLLYCFGEGDLSSWRSLRGDRRCGVTDPGEDVSFFFVCVEESGWAGEDSSSTGSFCGETALSGSAVSEGAGWCCWQSDVSASRVSSGLLTGCSTCESTAAIFSSVQMGISTCMSSADGAGAWVCWSKICLVPFPYFTHISRYTLVFI